MNLSGKIDFNSPLPYYYQLQEHLQTWMQNQALNTHDPLPSEGDLQAHFGVSRSVVRQALRQLETEGIIYRQKGRGSFVAPPKLRQQISSVTSFTDEMRSRGIQPGARVLHQAMVPAGEEAARHLALEAGCPVFFLERVRLADGLPLALESAYIHFDGCTALAEVDFSSASLYATLSDKFNLRYLESEQELEATLASPRESELLGLNSGAPVMLARFTTYSDGLHPVEYVKSTYRGDKYRFYTIMQRGANRGI